MTVSELIATLSTLDPNMPVVSPALWEDGVYKLVDVEPADVQAIPARRVGDVYEREPEAGSSIDVLVISVL